MPKAGAKILDWSSDTEIDFPIPENTESDTFFSEVNARLFQDQKLDDIPFLSVNIFTNKNEATGRIEYFGNYKLINQDS